jgi:hypothetical protein
LIVVHKSIDEIAPRAIERILRLQHLQDVDAGVPEHADDFFQTLFADTQCLFRLRDGLLRGVDLLLSGSSSHTQSIPPLTH